MTTSDERLIELVDPYIKQLRQNGVPYVWCLKLSSSTFDEIHDALKASIDSHKGDTRHLLSTSLAPCVMIYIAEWYKRCYEGTQSQPDDLKDFGSKEWKTVWENCGFPWDQYVYQQKEGASYRWIDSLYALGGLALPFRLNQDCSKLLLLLCKSFRRENVPIEDISRVGGSIAFRQSILQKGSLYYFFEHVLSGKLPYSAEELKDSHSDCNLLIKAIKEADKKACEEKFRFEWLIRNVPEREHLQRRLKVSLKPEPNMLGDSYRQYISYERLRNWGIQHSDKVSQLLFSLKYQNNGEVIKDCDFCNPLFIFSNRGEEQGNFVCWGTADSAIDNKIPVKTFNVVQLWVKADDEKPIAVPLPLKFDGYLQIFKSGQDRFEWTDRTDNQADTAVIFSDRWKEVTSEGHMLMIRKSFYTREEGESEPYSWCDVFEKIKLRDENGKEVSIDCRKGRDYVFPKCYPNDICYEDGFKVNHHYIEKFDEDDEEGVEMTDQLPILFGTQNLVCKHYESSDDTEGKECKPYFIEHKVGRNYEMVGSDSELKLGVEKLRVQVTASSSPVILTVFYVPWSEAQGCPVARDFDKNEIRVAETIIQNDYIRDHIEKNPCIGVRIGTDEDFVIINVFRPQDLVELYQNDKLIEYYNNRYEGIKIPLILCLEFRVRDYGEHGASDYHCRNLMKLYPSIFPLNQSCQIKPDGLIQSISEEGQFEYLNLCFFDLRDKEGGTWCAMDFNGVPKQIESSNIANWRGPGIVFDSLRSPFSRHCRERIEKRNLGGFGNRINTQMSCLEIYDVAALHRAYFFMFSPLGMMVRNNRVIDDLLLPVVNRSEGGVTDKEIKDLQRFAFEFGFRWSDKWATWEGVYENRAKVNDIIYRITTLE